MPIICFVIIFFIYFLSHQFNRSGKGICEIRCRYSFLCLQGGGGLVQQLKKSYSLSDLTGEKEDENRNTSSMRDETDMEGFVNVFNPFNYQFHHRSLLSLTSFQFLFAILIVYVLCYCTISFRYLQ